MPISDAYGTWRAGLGAWALTAAVAVIPWLGLLRVDRNHAESTGGTTPIRLAAVARTRLGWLMAGFFGLQALQAYAIFGWFAKIYRDAGFSPTTAGVLLALVTGISVPVSLLVPTLATRLRSPAPLVIGLVACYPVGYLGLVVAPVAGAALWAGVIGVGTCTFPLILTLIGLRADTPAGTAALSGFTQSLGYLVAALGPFGVGLLHDLTGSWTVPLITLTGLSLPLLLIGLAVSGPAAIEDQLDPSSQRDERPSLSPTEYSPSEDKSGSG